MRGRRAALQWAAEIRRMALKVFRPGIADDRDQATDDLVDCCGMGRGGYRWVVREVAVKHVTCRWPHGWTLVARFPHWRIARGFTPVHVDPNEIPF